MGGKQTICVVSASFLRGKNNREFNEYTGKVVVSASFLRGKNNLLRTP